MEPLLQNTEPRVNLHTHTCRCKHADGDVRDYCEAALENGLVALGISDHAPHPDGRWDDVRMDMSALPEYVASVNEAKKAYEGRLRIYLGLELELVPGEENYVKEELFGRYKLDYLIGAAHNVMRPDGTCFYFKDATTDEDLCVGTDYTIATMESGFFVYMAHPDWFAYAWRGWTPTAESCCRAICQAAKAYGIPLELNANGFRRKPVEDNGVIRPAYPLERFWEIAAEEGVTGILGADAHKPWHVWDNMENCRAIAQKYSLPLVNPEALLMYGGALSL